MSEAGQINHIATEIMTMIKFNKRDCFCLFLYNMVVDFIHEEEICAVQ
jgi:hypothetical protein